MEEADFQAAVRQIEAASGGILCFAAQNLDTGEVLAALPYRKVKTASVVKLPILVHVALSVAEGAFDWDEPLVLNEEEKVGGSGVLTQMTPGLALSLRDVCMLMTVFSDNTATNMVIERVGTGPVNARMAALGLENTAVFRKAYAPDTPESQLYGLGVTTPTDMIKLLTLLTEGKLGGHAVGSELMTLLETQRFRDAIPRLLPADWKYAGKTGAVDAVRNDVGIVTAPDGARYALALFCQNIPLVKWTADNPGLLALSRLAYLILSQWNPVLPPIDSNAT